VLLEPPGVQRVNRPALTHITRSSRLVIVQQDVICGDLPGPDEIRGLELQVREVAADEPPDPLVVQQCHALPLRVLLEPPLDVPH